MGRQERVGNKSREVDNETHMGSDGKEKVSQ